MFSWDFKQYLLFEKERNIAVKDLILQITHIQRSQPIQTILDVGCGPGNSTTLLKEAFKEAHILGIDSSYNMIEAALKLHLDSCDFKLCDANTELKTLNQQFDVIFANASLHWLSHQAEFLKNCYTLLKNQGVLAVQIPIDSLSVFHQILQALTQSPKWKDTFQSKRAFYSLSAEEYIQVLCECGYEFRIWESCYYHILPEVEAIMAWYKGSGLRAYLNQLDSCGQEEFENDVRQELYKSYGTQNNQGVILKVPRLFFVAKK